VDFAPEPKSPEVRRPRGKRNAGKVVVSIQDTARALSAPGPEVCGLRANSLADDDPGKLR